MILDITDEERIKAKEILSKFNCNRDDKDIFYNLCFCICAPQTKFKSNCKVLKELIRLDFYNKPIEKFNAKDNANNFISFCEILKPVRFYKNKAIFLLEMKENFSNILKVIRSSIIDNKVIDPIELRNWLIDNIKGIGRKTSSHFIRNLGDQSLAIIDTHIIKFMIAEGYYNIKEDDSLKSNYFEIERQLIDIADENDLTVAELDSILWKRYSKTPWEDFEY